MDEQNSSQPINARTQILPKEYIDEVVKRIDVAFAAFESDMDSLANFNLSVKLTNITPTDVEMLYRLTDIVSSGLVSIGTEMREMHSRLKPYRT